MSKQVTRIVAIVIAAVIVLSLLGSIIIPYI